MNLIQSSKDFITSPGMQAYYKAMDDAEVFMNSDNSLWVKCAIMVLGVLIIVGCVDWRKKNDQEN